MNDELPLIRIASGKNRSALRLAEKAHRGASRAIDGDVPYILHPVAVAEILAGLGADRNLVCAGCLHDVVEDTDVTLEQIHDEFGSTVAALVEAVTKGEELSGYVLEEHIPIIMKKLNAVGPDALALKGADLLANMTDLVLDAEERGVSSFSVIFGVVRAPRKIRHYTHLSYRICDALVGTRYDRLAHALDQRAAELTDLLVTYEAQR